MSSEQCAKLLTNKVIHKRGIRVFGSLFYLGEKRKKKREKRKEKREKRKEKREKNEDFTQQCLPHFSRSHVLTFSLSHVLTFSRSHAHGASLSTVHPPSRSVYLNRSCNLSARPCQNS